MKTAFRFIAPNPGVPNGFDEPFEPNQIIVLDKGDATEKAFVASDHFKRLDASELDAHLRASGEPENTIGDANSEAEVTRLQGELDTSSDLLKKSQAEVTRLQGELDTSTASLEKITTLLEVEAKDVLKTIKKLLKQPGE
jgi:hypothetical protein